MTRPELEALSPRELDAVCAEKVMGWSGIYVADAAVADI